jgi:hypothetical protein
VSLVVSVAMMLRVVLIGVFVCSCHSLIHKLDIKNSESSSVLIETFGFDVGGFQNISTSAFTIASVSVEYMRVHVAFLFF